MAPQISAGSIADVQFFDEGGIAQPTLREILDRFRMSMELELMESGGLSRSCILLEVSSQAAGKPEGCCLQDASRSSRWLPGFVDTYRVDFRVPDGVTGGTAAIQLSQKSPFRPPYSATRRA